MTGANAALAPRTRLLLEAPILPTLVRLSAPNLAEAAARVTFLTADAIFASWIGSEALAAVSIVFPLLLVVQSCTASGFGAGVASSIGHALGAGDHDRVRRLAGTAVALTLIAAAATTASMLLAGPALYRSMGASGPALDLAVRYGAMIFGGIGVVWLMNILANIARGAGNMLLPAFSIVAGEVCHVVLSPLLILGWGPVPRLGIEGAAIGALSAYAVGSAVIGVRLCSRQALARLEPRRLTIAMPEARAILDIGAPAAASVLVFWSINLFTVAIVGQLGSASIAAYGMATRLDTVQYPIIFAFGSSLVTMVATAIGAGDQRRASRIAGTGCAVAGMIALVFTVIALFGDAWMRLFTADPIILATGALYLVCEAPVLPLFGAGIAAAWACMAAGMVRPPLVVSFVRLLIAVGSGWIMLALTRQALPVFVASAAGAGAYGLGMIAVLHHRFAGGGWWRRVIAWRMKANAIGG